MRGSALVGLLYSHWFLHAFRAYHAPTAPGPVGPYALKQIVDLDLDRVLTCQAMASPKKFAKGI